MLVWSGEGLSDEVFLLQRDLHEVWERTMKKCGKNILGREDGQCKGPEAGVCLAESSKHAGAECLPRRVQRMASFPRNLWTLVRLWTSF